MGWNRREILRFIRFIGFLLLVERISALLARWSDRLPGLQTAAARVAQSRSIPHIPEGWGEGGLSGGSRPEDSRIEIFSAITTGFWMSRGVFNRVKWSRTVPRGLTARSLEKAALARPGPSPPLPASLGPRSGPVLNASSCCALAPAAAGPSMTRGRRSPASVSMAPGPTRTIRGFAGRHPRAVPG